MTTHITSLCISPCGPHTLPPTFCNTHQLAFTPPHNVLLSGSEIVKWSRSLYQVVQQFSHSNLCRSSNTLPTLPPSFTALRCSLQTNR